MLKYIIMSSLSTTEFTYRVLHPRAQAAHGLFILVDNLYARSRHLQARQSGACDRHVPGEPSEGGADLHRWQVSTRKTSRCLTERFQSQSVGVDTIFVIGVEEERQCHANWRREDGILPNKHKCTTFLGCGGGHHHGYRASSARWLPPPLPAPVAAHSSNTQLLMSE